MAKKTTNKAKKTPFSIGYILIFLAVMYVAQMFLSPKAEELSYSQFRLYLKNGYISDCTVGQNLIRGHYKKYLPKVTKKKMLPLLPYQYKTWHSSMNLNPRRLDLKAP